MKDRPEQKTHYQTFAASLEATLERFRDGRSKAQYHRDKLIEQNQQVADLIRNEREFVDALSVQDGLKSRVFKAFLDFVRSQPRVATIARPYTRERHLVYTREFMPAIESNDWRKLPRFAFNWTFICFVWAIVEIKDKRLQGRLKRLTDGSLPAIPGPPVTFIRRPLADYLLDRTENLRKLRHELVVTNLPLVVDRASAFERSTPETPLIDQMDHISTATEGFMCGVDKVMIECRPSEHWKPTWHPVDQSFAYWRGQSASARGEPYTYPEFVVSGFRVEGHHTAAKHTPKEERPQDPANVFRTTAIGRMGAKLISSYSQTHMHLGPDDKRLLYQCNKVAGKYADSTGTDFGAVAERVLQERIAWTLAQRFGLDSRDISEEIGEALEQAGPGQWGQIGERLGGAYEGAEEVVARAQKRAPSREAVAKVMLACSTVSTIDDEGEDRLNEASAYAAPTSAEPDVMVENNAEREGLQIALRLLSILERKVLVLLGLADMRCLQPIQESA